MFKIFPFGFSGVFNLGQLGNVAGNFGGIIETVLNNIDMDLITEEIEDMFLSNEEDNIESETDQFIYIEEYDDMYLLTINVMGVDLRELSIKYNPGVIEVNMNRSEIESNNFAGFTTNTVVKKRYNKIFENIEEIDINSVIKTIDDGFFKMTMPKQYVIEDSSNIVEIDNYIES